MMTLEDIKQGVRALTVEQRKQLIAFVVDSLTEREGHDNLHSILEFEGIAAHQADDEDPQEYVNGCVTSGEERVTRIAAHADPLGLFRTSLQKLPQGLFC